MARFAVFSAGEMGAAVGARLVEAGHSVTTLLAGRGPETLTRAAEAGFEDRESMAALVGDCDVFLSILPPAQAVPLATQVAAHAGVRAFAFVDCNAISPQRMAQVAEQFRGTNVKVMDGGIVGGPPKGAARPRLYWSGPPCALLDQTNGAAFDCRDLGREIGAASGMKMTYAAMTKGVNSLLTAAILAASRLDFLEPLLSELAQSQPELSARAHANIPRLPADAARWVAEMEEIAACLDAVDVPPEFHLGAAKIMDILAASPFGHETRRTRDQSRDLAGTIKGLR